MKKCIKIFCLFTVIVYIFPLFCHADDIDTLQEDLKFTDISSNISKEPSINSKSAVVIERSTGVILYGKNENDKRKMASTTKIMTAIIVLETINNLDEIITVSSRAACIGGSRLGLSNRCKISIKDLLYGLMLCSGNDAAVALAEYVGKDIDGFANLMNIKAKEIGLTNTNFVTPHGLDDENHYTTAYELAILTNYALNNALFKKIVSTQCYTVTINGYKKQLTNTNELLGNLSGTYGVKTGFTNGANRCLVTACKRNNLDIICVVLGADTKKFRFQDSRLLIEYIYNNYKMVNLNEKVNQYFEDWKRTNVNKFVINKSIESTFDIYIKDFPYELYPINSHNIDTIDIQINCNYIYDAPIFKNTTIGSLKVKINNNNLYNLDILLSYDIYKKQFSSYLLTFISNYINYLENIF